MTAPRNQLVDLNVSRYYHCISRCVRQAMLCGFGFEHRKEWIERRLKLLAENFAVSVCRYAVMDNYLHTLVRLDATVGQGWDADDVVRRWIKVYPPKNLNFDDERNIANWVNLIV